MDDTVERRFDVDALKHSVVRLKFDAVGRIAKEGQQRFFDKLLRGTALRADIADDLHGHALHGDNSRVVFRQEATNAASHNCGITRVTSGGSENGSCQLGATDFRVRGDRGFERVRVAEVVAHVCTATIVRARLNAKRCVCKAAARLQGANVSCPQKTDVLRFSKVALDEDRGHWR